MTSSGDVIAPAGALDESAKMAALEQIEVQIGSVVPSTMAQVWHMATFFANSELVQNDLKGKPRKVCLILLKGISFGISVTEAIEEIGMIKGRPSPSAKLLLALIRSSGMVDPAYGIRRKYTGQGEELSCTVSSKRVDQPEPDFDEFSIADAKVAGLYTRNDSWKRYPKRMVLWRAVSQHADWLYSDVIDGTQKLTQTITDYPTDGNVAFNEFEKPRTVKLKDPVIAQFGLDATEDDVATDAVVIDEGDEHVDVPIDPTEYAEGFLEMEAEGK